MRLFERLPRDTAAQTNVPDAAFSAPTSFLVFDHLTRRVALLHDGPDSERQALRREVIERLRGPVPAARADVEISPATASLSEAEFTDRVNACKEYIAAGDIYQIVLSILFRGRTNVQPFEVYRAMRLLNPSPYMFILELGEFSLVGSSPEVHVRALEGRIDIRPIAGTRWRGATPEEDKELAEDLLIIMREGTVRTGD